MVRTRRQKALAVGTSLSVVCRNGLALKDDAVTLAHCFGEAGYATGYIGKWHLGGQTASKERQLIAAIRKMNQF